MVKLKPDGLLLSIFRQLGVDCELNLGFSSIPVAVLVLCLAGSGVSWPGLMLMSCCCYSGGIVNDAPNEANTHNNVDRNGTIS